MHTTEAVIELNDIQGYLIRGYKRMGFSTNVMLQITNATAAKKWLNSLTDAITTGEHRPSTDLNFETCINIAFTPDGLTALGLSDENLQNFTREYREGMTTSHRQRLLGDYGSSSPDSWRWGGPKNDAIHILLMLFAESNAKLQQYYNDVKQQFTVSGCNEVIALDGCTLDANREHFGFRDGIGQPIVAGSGRKGPVDDVIATGEFIMGYKNEYGVYPDSPLIAAEQGNMNLLPADAGGTGYKDLGRNGSYLVFRQIQQDVDAFWTFMNEKTGKEDGSVDVTESTRLASKMIGRWPSGDPLVKFPDADGITLSDDNDFSYNAVDNKDYTNDKDGYKCPFGSHIRRANPRDSFEDNTPKESIRLTKRHRIIRRSKLYGNPYAGSPLNHSPEGEVGLLFQCFNADISRQFEFIQYTWAGYPKFKELYNDPDPIIGTREVPDHGQPQNFTIQQYPVSQCVKGLQRFIQIKGGAYFFFPAITAIRYISSL